MRLLFYGGAYTRFAFKLWAFDSFCIFSYQFRVIDARGEGGATRHIPRPIRWSFRCESPIAAEKTCGACRLPESPPAVLLMISSQTQSSGESVACARNGIFGKARRIRPAPRPLHRRRRDRIANCISFRR